MVRKPDQHHVRCYRSLFLSDLHLGAPGCRADALLAFLQGHDAETIYLVGDTFDLWDPLFVTWGATERQIVSLISSRVTSGRRVVCLVGNHDRALLTEQARARPEVAALAMEIHHEIVHLNGDGTRLLVLHGDVCDARLLRFHIWTRLGSRVDSFLRMAYRSLRGLRPRLDRGVRSPVEALITGLNGMLYRGRGHERRLVALARTFGCDGVICGHFHIAALHDEHGLRYANCGDWTDSCTALAEDWDGSLALIGFPQGADARIGKLAAEVA